MEMKDILFDRYVRLCKTLNTKGDLVSMRHLKDNYDKIISSDVNADWYSSLFYYHGAAKQYYDSHGGSLAGFDGKALSDKLVFDFDSEAIEQAQKDAIVLLDRLSEIGVNVEDSVRVFFSGGKGFHVEVPLEGTDLTPEELKLVCSNIASGLETFDSKIYNTTRIYRLPNTKHNKTGLFKIELEPYDLYELTVDQIKDKAKEPINSTFTPVPANITERINKLKKTDFVPKAPVKVSSEGGIRGLNEIDFTRCPTYIPRCIYALSKGVMVAGVGERSAVFLRLATFYRNQGMDKEVAYNTLKGIARLNANLYPEQKAFPKRELWNNVIAVVYNEHEKNKPNPGGWGTDPENDLLKKYCTAIKSDKKCPLHSKNEAVKSVVHIDDVSDSFKNFAETFKSNIVKTGIGLIDSYMKIPAGTTTLLVGACGSGKTTVALNIMENANHLDQYTMFFSLDMHKNLVYLKLAQKLTNYTQNEILNFYETKQQDKIKEIREAIAKKYGKTLFDFSNTLTVEQMRDKVFAAEEQLGKKIRLVVVDYAGRITGPFADRYANATYNALKSVEVADQTNAAWIYLSQISRNMGDGMTPLRTKRVAKESGDWEESATNVITLWRPFMGVEGKDDIMRMYLAKNRLGTEIERPLFWDGAKGAIRDMDEMEYEEYRSQREKEEKDLIRARLSKS